METRDSIADIWGQRTPYAGENRWPVRVDQRTSSEPDRWVRASSRRGTVEARAKVGGIVKGCW